jgi:hypothetical protein
MYFPVPNLIETPDQKSISVGWAKLMFVGKNAMSVRSSEATMANDIVFRLSILIFLSPLLSKKGIMFYLA